MGVERECSGGEAATFSTSFIALIAGERERWRCVCHVSCSSGRVTEREDDAGGGESEEGEKMGTGLTHRRRHRGFVGQYVWM